MKLEAINLSGAKVTGAMTPLGQVGPKHFGIIAGFNPVQNQTYIVEKMHFGYQLCTYQNFKDRYSFNGKIHVIQNNGTFSNISVANRAINEMNSNANRKYNLVLDNCESFSNRATHNRSISFQVIRTFSAFILIVSLILFSKKKMNERKA